MCSKNASHAKMWSREGVISAESVSLPFAGQCSAQYAVASTRSVLLKKVSGLSMLNVVIPYMYQLSCV